MRSKPNTSVAGLPASVSAGAAVAAVAPNTISAGGQQLIGARAALGIQVLDLQPGLAEIAALERHIAGREEGVDAALPVDHAPQLGLGQRHAALDQAEAGQRAGGGQDAAAGGERGLAVMSSSSVVCGTAGKQYRNTAGFRAFVMRLS